MATDRSFIPAAGPPHAPLPTAAEPRVGVFICECGDKISSILDVDDLAASTGARQDVAFADHAPYWCSSAGLDRLQETIGAERLDRVIVAGCSARTHRNLFRDTTGRAGLHPELLSLVNIREGCAWPHRADPEAATLRADAQIGMEVAHSTAFTPRIPVQTRINPSAAVIGGGIAGMTAAVELADAGTPVTLIERTAALGGTATEDADELAMELRAAVEACADIRVRCNSRITAVSGSVGAYRVSLDSGNGASAERLAAGPFGAVIVATGAPDDATGDLADMLRLPQDRDGYLSELRVRLRPERHLERGVYVCGGAHHPCDPTMAQFQAFSAASRALRHLERGSMTLTGPGAEIADERCTGCSDCARACPFTAITMIERPLTAVGYGSAPDGAVGLAQIDPLLCTGCGNCVSVCPVDAATLTGWSDAQLEAQMKIALNGNREPRILVFACEWSGHAAAELAGAQMRSYPADVRLVRLDCTGRLQSALILDAFEMGAAGVLVLGCAPKLCHYERGNERAAAACQQAEDLTSLLGVDPCRLRLAWAPPDDGAAFAELITEFADGVTAASL
jgi:heterodisulfide reductase subunit A-like polyferredoxin/coenzyme F420-reducing hydrogenase delta subunit